MINLCAYAFRATNYYCTSKFRTVSSILKRDQLLYITEILASRRSAHGWRAMVSTSNLTAGMCRFRNFDSCHRSFYTILGGVYTAKIFRTWIQVSNKISPPKTQIDSLIRDLTWISELVRLNFDQLGCPS
jgi:hypothetical protein